jgi:hypothetical protein
VQLPALQLLPNPALTSTPAVLNTRNPVFAMNWLYAMPSQVKFKAVSSPVFVFTPPGTTLLESKVNAPGATVPLSGPEVAVAEKL